MQCWKRTHPLELPWAGTGTHNHQVPRPALHYSVYCATEAIQLYMYMYMYIHVCPHVHVNIYMYNAVSPPPQTAAAGAVRSVWVQVLRCR